MTDINTISQTAYRQNLPKVSPELPARNRKADTAQENNDPGAVHTDNRDSFENSSAEKTTVNTDKVDKEVEKLKSRKQELEIQLVREEDSRRRADLEKKIEQVRKELSQKDNENYRRQNAEVL